MRIGLAASTVTPGRTAPDESVTTPEMLAALVPCAKAANGREATRNNATSILPTLSRTLMCNLHGDTAARERLTGENPYQRIQARVRRKRRPVYTLNTQENHEKECLPTDIEDGTTNDWSRSAEPIALRTIGHLVL